MLADIFAGTKGKKEDAMKVFSFLSFPFDRGRLANLEKALDLLAQKYDPIRANYWRYRKAQLTTATTALDPRASSRDA